MSGRREAPPVDFHQLFQAASGNTLVLTPELTVAAVSDDYLRATGTTREQLLGCPLSEVYAAPRGAADLDATKLHESLGRVIARRRPDTVDAVDLAPRPPGAQGTDHRGIASQRWCVVNTPVLGADAQLAYILHRLERGAEPRARAESDPGRGNALRWSHTEERYSQLLNAAPDAIVVVSSDGRIQLVSAQTEQLFGYPREALLGHHLDLLIPTRFKAGHDEHLQRYFANPGARPMGSGLELFGRHRDGAEIPIEVSLSPLRTEDGIMVSAAIRDISERKRMEAAAKLLADRLSSAVDSIQDGFVIFDEREQLVLCNSVYRRLVGETLSGPLVGKPYEQILDAWLCDLAFDNDEERARFRAERLAPRAHVSTFDVRTRDGRHLRTMARRTPEGGVVKTIWDLTDDVRLAEELMEARKAAEAASNAKSDFLSSMSHELRTPLNAILGFAQLLQRDKKEPLSERHRERVSQILKGGEHLLRLIDDILDLSRIEAGGVSISTEPVGVAEVLAEIQTTLGPFAARQGIRLRIEALPTEASMVSVDRTRFVQILMNLGSNAIKYNRPDGEVTFTVAMPRPGLIRVTVRDTGMGIPEAKQGKLFQPFQRAGQETGPIEGTGIGLVITRRLAQLMHGDVGFHSVSGEGSMFWVDVPLHEASAHASAPQRVREGASSNLGGERRRRILYVEDNPANVAFMKDLISAFDNIDMVTALTAEIGVALAREHRPEVIIMDINLPGMSGLDALRELQDAPETKEIPVIALTAAASDRDQQRGIQAGFHRYLTKPVKVDEFLTALETLLAATP